MNTDHVDIVKVTYFVLHVINNRRNHHLESRFAMLYVAKGERKKFAPTKSLPPDHKSLTMKTLWAYLVSLSWGNCLDCHLIFCVMAGFLSMMFYNIFGIKGRRNLVKSKLSIISEKKVRCWGAFLQGSEEIDENLTDVDDDDDDERESDE